MAAQPPVLARGPRGEEQCKGRCRECQSQGLRARGAPPGCSCAAGPAQAGLQSKAEGLPVMPERRGSCFTTELRALHGPLMSRVLSQDPSPFEKTFKRF